MLFDDCGNGISCFCNSVPISMLTYIIVLKFRLFAKLAALQFAIPTVFPSDLFHLVDNFMISTVLEISKMFVTEFDIG